MIAPVVAYLCHEDTEDNGAIIESAAGWATKVHFVRDKPLHKLIGEIISSFII